MGTTILRLWLPIVCIVAAVVSGVHSAIWIKQAEVVIVHRLATFRKLEKVALHDLLHTRLIDTAVDAN